MQTWFNSCSFGQVSFTNATNLVVGPIPVPCYSQVSGSSFSYNQCSLNEIYGWAQWAEDYIQNVGWLREGEGVVVGRGLHTE